MPISAYSFAPTSRPCSSTTATCATRRTTRSPPYCGSRSKGVNHEKDPLQLFVRSDRLSPPCGRHSRPLGLRRLERQGECCCLRDESSRKDVPATHGACDD